MVSAQDTIPVTPHNLLAVGIQAKAVSQVGSTITLRYRVRVTPGSGQIGEVVAVRLGVGGAVVTGPDHWDPSTVVMDDSLAAFWLAHDSASAIPISGETSGFDVLAVGVLDVVGAVVRGWNNPPDATQFADDAVKLPPPSFWENSARGVTIGHAPIPPGATVASLRTRLAGLVGRACGELGWIPSPPLCTSLTNQLTGYTLRLGDFQALLDANRTAGVQLEDNPYYLLASNREYLRSLIGPQQVGLVYVCGNKFKARNRLDVNLPATWTSLTSSASGTLTLPARPANGEYSETPFEVPSAAVSAVRLRYEGQVVGESNPTQTPC